MGDLFWLATYLGTIFLFTALMLLMAAADEPRPFLVLFTVAAVIMLVVRWLHSAGDRP